MAKGNPNPSPSTRIGAPNGPPPGKSVVQKSLEMQNAEAAVRIRARMLKASEGRIAKMTDDEIAALIEPAMLKLLTDSETRGLGAPVQPITGGDGGALQITIKRYADD